MKHLALAFLCLLLLVNLQAEEAGADSIRQYTLRTIKVVAERPGQSIGTITIKPIEKGVDDSPLNLREALEHVPGISATTGTKDESNLRIRGFRKNEVKILIDGRPLTGSYFGNVDLNSIPLSGIKEAIIIKGPGSAIYGSGSMGGVVNLITASPSQQDWVTLGLTAKRNNNNTIELSSSHSFEDWDYWIYGSRDNSDGAVLSDAFEPTAYENGGVRNNSHKLGYNFQSRWGFTLADFHQLGLNLGLNYIPRKEIASSIFETKYRLYEDWLRSQGSLSYSYEIGPQTSMDALVYYDGAQDHYFEYNDANYQVLGVDSQMNNQLWGFNPKLKWELSPKSLLNLGYRAEISSSNRKDNGNYPEWTAHQTRLHQGFAQYEYLWEELRINGSVGLVMASSDVKPQYKTYLEPALGMIWQTAKLGEFSLSLGRNIAFPTMRQLFSLDHGNPDLTAQSALKTELAHRIPLRLLSRDLALSTAVFYNRSIDLIDEYQGLYQNLEQVDSWGLELSVLIQATDRLELDLNYNCLDYQGKSGYQLTESPGQSAELFARLELPWKLKLSLSSIYQGSRLSEDSAYVLQELQPYWMHNIQLQRIWDKLRVYAGLENILDQDFESEWGYPAAGRNFNLGLELKL